MSWDEGDSAAARDYYEQSLFIAREVGDEHAIAAALNNLGMVARDEGDYSTAMARYKEALKIFGAPGETAAVANSLLNLGLLSETWMTTRQAVSTWTRAWRRSSR